MGADTLLLLDGDNLCHRAYYALGKGLSHKEIPTGVVYGFLKDIEYFQDRFRASHFIFCFDHGENKRKKICFGYKAGRKEKHPELEEQIDLLKREYLRELGFRNVFYQDGYEADDLLAAVSASLAEDELNDVIIISGDHDLYQCLRPTVSVYHPRGRELVTLRKFRTEYGIHPKNWAAVKAIAGCTTDKVPGVEGVGELTAIKYLNDTLPGNHKTFDKIANWINSPRYDFSLRLVRLPLHGVELPVIREDEFRPENWHKLADRLGMHSLRDKPPLIGRYRKGLF